MSLGVKGLKIANCLHTAFFFCSPTSLNSLIDNVLSQTAVLQFFHQYRSLGLEGKAKLGINICSDEQSQPLKAYHMELELAKKQNHRLPTKALGWQTLCTLELILEGSRNGDMGLFL